MLDDQRRRLRADIDHHRYEYMLARHAAAGIGVAQALEGDPLVCRVLVDHHQGIAAFTDEIALEDLSDDAQVREEPGRSTYREHPSRSHDGLPFRGCEGWRCKR